MSAVEVCVIDWHITPARAERWYEIWKPVAERALAYGASSWSLTRAEDDPLHFRQTSIGPNREEFDAYWYSDDLAAARAEALQLFHKPLLPEWHSLIASG